MPKLMMAFKKKEATMLERGMNENTFKRRQKLTTGELQVCVSVAYWGLQCVV